MRKEDQWKKVINIISKEKEDWWEKIIGIIEEEQQIGF